MLKESKSREPQISVLNSRDAHISPRQLSKLKNEPDTNGVSKIVLGEELLLMVTEKQKK